MCAPLRSAHCPVPQRSAYPPAAMASVPTRCVTGMGERRRGGCSASGRAEVRGGVTSSSPCGLPSNGSGHSGAGDAAPGSGRVRRHQDRRLPPSSGTGNRRVKEQCGRQTYPAEHQLHPPRPGRSGGQTRDRDRRAEQSTACAADDRTRPTGPMPGTDPPPTAHHPAAHRVQLRPWMSPEVTTWPASHPHPTRGDGHGCARPALVR